MTDLKYPNFEFDITYNAPNSQARLGTLKTPHGTIQTPNYIFCGTKAAIKNLNPDQMVEAKTDIILSNTYHLMVQPGADVVEKMGGLHAFMGWDGPMLTDSGGFQIFSMGHGSVADEIKGRNKGERKQSLLKITEAGAEFRSYKDGSKMMLTPERSMDIQRQLGADLIMQFDECTAFHVDRDYTEESMHRSHRWGDRCLEHFEKSDNGAQAVYGIVQGGVYDDLRAESCAWTKNGNFFGTAIGGSLGGSKQQFYEIVSWCTKQIHQERPVHLLGIGAIDDIFKCVRLGIDTFDCVSPTRAARHGWAIMKGVPGNRINIKNAKYREDASPLLPESDIKSSNFYSKAYIHHLIKAKEMLGMQILSQHNVYMMNMLMRDIREAIANDTLDACEKEWRCL
tara:strand:+ start:478144 stop:479331 length:1188 start_codon:yes stop_codon:yes gene_type:complete